MVRQFKIICGLLTSLCLLVITPALSESKRKALESFSLNDHLGNVIDLESYHRQVVMVNFWATWCSPCVEEFPTIQELKSTFADQPFEVLAINLGEDLASIDNFIANLQKPLNFPVLLDPLMTVANKWQSIVLPTTVFVDKNGKHAFRYTGKRNWNDTDSQQKVFQLLNE